MGKQTVTGVDAFIKDREISGLTNSITLNHGVDAQDATDMEKDTETNIAGLEQFDGSYGGFWDATEDSNIFPEIGDSKQVMTISPDNASEGNTSFFFEAPNLSYEFGEQVGNIFPFTLNFQSASNLIRGTSAKNAVGTAETSSGTGTAFNLGSVSSGQSLYANLHVLDASGDGSQTLDVEIESDDDSAFPSPTTRITFSQVGTSTEAQFSSTAGAITDTHYRVKWTIGGTGSPSFKFLVSIGIK